MSPHPIRFALLSFLSFDNLAWAVPSIDAESTIGAVADVCDASVPQNCSLPASSFVELAPGEDLVVGHEVTNTGSDTLPRHDLDDSALGEILVDFPFTLAPGASGFIIQLQTLVAPFIRSARWTARSATGYATVATDLYSLLVPSLFKDGFEPE